MSIPTSGSLAFTALQTEFGGTSPIALSEYYAGGDYVPATASGTNGDVPSSGALAMSKFYGTENVVFMAATGGTTSTSGDYKFHDGKVELIEYEQDEDDLDLWRANILFNCTVTEVFA